MTLRLADLLKARNLKGKGKFYDPLGPRIIDQQLSQIESVGRGPWSAEVFEGRNVGSGATIWRRHPVNQSLLDGQILRPRIGRVETRRHPMRHLDARHGALADIPRIEHQAVGLPVFAVGNQRDDVTVVFF